MEFEACGVGPSGFFGYGALDINIKEQPWEKMVRSSPILATCARVEAHKKKSGAISITLNIDTSNPKNDFGYVNHG